MTSEANGINKTTNQDPCMNCRMLLPSLSPDYHKHCPLPRAVCVELFVAGPLIPNHQNTHNKNILLSVRSLDDIFIEPRMY